MVIRAGRVTLERTFVEGDGTRWDESDVFVSRYLDEARQSLWRHEWDLRKRQVFRVRDRVGDTIGEVELVDIRRGPAVAEVRICLFAPRSRGKGLGEVALRAALAHARHTLGLRAVYLRVYEDNERAIACYEKCGFVRSGKVRRPDGEIVILMEADLTQGGGVTRQNTRRSAASASR